MTQVIFVHVFRKKKLMPRSSLRRRSGAASGRKRLIRKPANSQSSKGKAFKGGKPKLYVPNNDKIVLPGRSLTTQGFALPANYWCTHRYVSNQLMTNQPDGSFGVDLYFRLNSLYEPQTNYSNKHQPYLFNQMRQFYNARCVYKVDIQVKVIFATNRANALGLYIKKGNNTMAIQGLQPAVVQELPNAVIIGTGTGDMEFQTFETTVDIAQLVGRTRNQILTEVDYSEVGNGTVQEECFMGIASSDWSGNANQDVRIVVTLTQYARWTTLLNPGPS